MIRFVVTVSWQQVAVLATVLIAGDALGGYINGLVISRWRTRRRGTG